MKILTWNVNGYKSAYEKGDLKKILNSDYDIICLQEVRNSDIDAIKSTIPNSYNAYFNECKRKGHNGVMVLSKNMTESVDYTIQHERFDEDGRLINRNLGWRIDYFFVSKSMQENIKNVKIYKDIYGSDHVPMEINIKETKR